MIQGTTKPPITEHRRAISKTVDSSLRARTRLRTVEATLLTSLLWNKGERVEILDGDCPHQDLPHPGTVACGDVARVQPPKVRVVDPAASLQPVEHIARAEVRGFYQISETRWTN